MNAAIGQSNTRSSGCPRWWKIVIKKDRDPETGFGHMRSINHETDSVHSELTEAISEGCSRDMRQRLETKANRALQ